jgi:hypothetical protein
MLGHQLLSLSNSLFACCCVASNYHDGIVVLRRNVLCTFMQAILIFAFLPKFLANLSKVTAKILTVAPMVFSFPCAA